ncbi:hypothetical protein ACLOJK_004130 [Asimina triloba]
MLSDPDANANLTKKRDAMGADGKIGCDGVNVEDGSHLPESEQICRRGSDSGLGCPDLLQPSTARKKEMLLSSPVASPVVSTHRR